MSLCYKEVMEHSSESNIILADVSIQEAFDKFQKAKNSVLIVRSTSEILLGSLTKDDFFDAYLLKLPHENSVDQIINKEFEIVSEFDMVRENPFQKAHFLIVIDQFGCARGFLTEEILSKKLYQLCNRKITKEIKTKKILHGGESPERMTKNEDFTDYIDLYNRINRLIHINNELWDIIEYSSDSIYVADGEGITVYANDAFERMTGAPVSAVLGKSVFEAEREGIYRPSICAIVLSEKRQVTLIQRGLNGKDLIVTGTPVFDPDGNIYMVICNSKDIDDLSILKNYLINIKAASVKTVDDSDLKSRVIYTSDYMVNLMKLVNKVTMVDSTVMITGESGTGKGLIARYIHENSSRSNEKMIEINCSAIPEPLFESELFGYESGAFTGAQKGGKPGIIEMANGGTLLLDEIGDMPMHMQVKLLKVLQDRQVTRVGALAPTKIDVRVIAATNKDLKTLIENGLFRTDLYYRLNVFPINIAPLRERKEDIYTLLQHFLLYYNKKHNNKITLTHEAQDKIASYRWLGNVRELEHFVERLVIIKEGIVDAYDIEMEHDFELEKSGVKVNRILPLKEAVNETEKQLIDLAMKISQNSYEVADILGISQANAYRKMKKYK